MMPVKFVLGWLCAAMAFGFFAMAGIAAWVGGRFAAAGKWVMAP